MNYSGLVVSHGGEVGRHTGRVCKGEKKELLRAVDEFTILMVVKVSWIYLPPQKNACACMCLTTLETAYKWNPTEFIFL